MRSRAGSTRLVHGGTTAWLPLGVVVVLVAALGWLVLRGHGGEAPGGGGPGPPDPAADGPELRPVELAPGDLAALPGEGPVVVDLHYLGSPEEAPLRPKRAGSLSGRVVDTAGEVLPGARLEVLGGPQAGLQVRCGPDGQFLFQELLPGTHFFRIDTGEGRVVRLQRILARGPTRRDFVVGDAVGLVLRVRDGEGAALEGATVRVDLGEQEALTGADGLASFGAVPRGPRVPVDILAEGHVPTRHELNLLPLLAQDAGPVDLPALQRGGTIVGQVKSWPGGPLPRVTVVPRTDRPGPQQAIWERWQGVETTPDGFFRLEGLPTTRLVDIRVFHPEGVSRPPLLARRADPNQTVSVSFIVERGGRRIAGTVVGPERRPLAGVRVVLEAADPAAVLAALYPVLSEGAAAAQLPVPGALRRELTTAGDGAFDFAWADHPQGSGYLVLRASKPGFAAARVEVRSALASFTMRLEPEDRTGELRLSSSDGGPLPDDVSWFLEGEPIEKPAALLRGLYQVQVRRGEHVLAQEDAFLVSGVTRLPLR